MALFNRRKQNTDVLPEEVREYYQTERRDRTGMAWLLAAGTLLVTFVIAAVLFFGGRWAYRAVFNHNDKTNKTANTDNSLRVDENGNVTGNNQQQSSNNSSGQSTGTSSTSTSTPSPSNTNNSSSTPSNSGANGTAAKPTTTPNTGPVELINTGPGDETGM